MGFWPLPWEVTSGGTTLWLSPGVNLCIQKTEVRDASSTWYEGLGNGQGYNFVFPTFFYKIADNSPQSLRLKTASTVKPPDLPDDLVRYCFDRMKSTVFQENIVPDKFHPHRAQFEPPLTERRNLIETLTVREASDLPAAISREAYAININRDGTVIIDIASQKATVPAFETFCQAFYAHSGSQTAVYTPHAPLSIRDAPFYEHRGLHLDISRNWIPPEDVMRTIVGLGMNKINRLHIHASDSQSWPLEIPSIPDLAKAGAYREDQIWSAADLARVQRHGSYHGVEVYIEIDMPGHTGSIYYSHPHLVTGFNQRPWDKYAQEPPSGQLRLNSPHVYQFLDTLFDDLVPRISSYSSRFHVGGDELNTEVYAIDPTVNSSSKEVIRPLLQKFFDHVTNQLLARGMTPFIWQDMLLNWDLKLPPETVVQAWRPGGLQAIVAKGHRALFGACEDWYLDCGFGTFIDPATSEESPIKRPFADWCAPYKNWRRILSYDPLAEVSPDQQHLVIGGEVHLWTELVDSTSLDFMLWPRVAAAAEMLWKGKGEVCEGTTRRLAEMRERLLKHGIRAQVVQMEWGLRYQGECVL